MTYPLQPKRRVTYGVWRATALLVGALACGGLSWAGNWHYGEIGLRCSDCHVMHASQRGIGFGGAPVSPLGYGKLLRAASVSELCLTCHDGAAGNGDTAPDVSGAASYEASALKRVAGAFQAAPGLVTVSGHDLSVPNEVATGGTWTTGTGMTCTACHAAHGNTLYRNLVPRPGNSSSDRLVAAVEDTVLTPTSAQYSVTNVSYTSSVNGLGAWCQGCHTRFHGSPGDADLGGAAGGDTPGSDRYWFRHPTSGVTMAGGVANGHVGGAYWFQSALSRVPVVSPTSTVPGTSATSDNEVFCGSCHKAHGSAHRAGLIWDDPATIELEDGTMARQTCQACHDK